MLQRVVIGIYLHSETSRLAETLGSLARHSSGVPVVLLPAGYASDYQIADALLKCPQLLRLGSAKAAGIAAAFNRLARFDNAEIIVLLESGTIVTDRWLIRLCEALGAKPANGLAGPSTNLSWNEQCIKGPPAAEADVPSLDKFSLAVASRHKECVATLAPLYSLADFCYAVKREVIDTIGPADEGYGVGPCWEMDYNIRAARAGFEGIWVKSAYVHRRPLDPLRVADEREWLDRNKHRYQDMFCGLRLSGGKKDYRPHCRGDACPNFAPRSVPLCVPASEPAPLVTIRATPSEPPLASCIMPTGDRRRFAVQAVQYFQRQDYSPRELIIVDDGRESIREFVPAGESIRYICLDKKVSLGEKRNLACREARGEIIIHWDDDDWMASDRISRQVNALQREHADVCGLSTLLFHEPASGRSWRYCYGGARRDWVAGGTLCYRKEFWKSNPFSSLTIGEDARFLWSARSKKLLVLNEESLYVAMVHSHNTSPKRTGDPQWQPIPTAAVLKLLGEDAGWYRDTTKTPALVSCIMPTRNRRDYVSHAITYFQRQNYQPRELIVIDDGEDRVSDLMPQDSFIRYIYLPTRHTLGEKRNLAVEAAQGEYIVHWDDDDWYAPNRLNAQVQLLESGKADVAALAMRTVLSLPDLKFWRCRPEVHARIHHRDVCCGTIAYPRSLWKKYGPYPRINCGEDVRFLASFERSAHIARVADEEMFICVRHGQNTWPIGLDWKREPRGWESVSAPDFLASEDLLRYSALCARAPHDSIAV